MPSQRLTVVDAFTDRPFRGNPAAVAILESDRPDEWMQAVAAELNLAETAFLRPLDSGVWGLRWFTPTTEVRLCGHATLASAHVLWNDGHAGEDTLRFRTLSGELRASRSDELVWLDFPKLTPRVVAEPAGLAAALGARPGLTVWTDSDGPGRSSDLLIEMASVDAVLHLAPDMNALAQVPCRGVIATAFGTGDVDFVSRFFAPACGIPEDPVTGSAHCLLGPYWAERLGTDRFAARQVSRRGGELRVELAGDRVLIGGRAVTVSRVKLVANPEPVDVR